MSDRQGVADAAGSNANAQADVKQGKNYWNSVAADDNAMLGDVPSASGFRHVPKVDLQGSRTFLARMGIGTKHGRHDVNRVLEAGAGVGRVTCGLLLNVAKTVDVIEPVAKFTAALGGNPGVGKIFNVGLQDWAPDEGDRYDLIWVQWCVGYLDDEQLVAYLERCKATLTPEKGLIVVKENLSTSGKDYHDATDDSVIREDEKFRSIFAQAALRIVRTDLQRGMPERATRRLLPVRMYALKP